MAHVTIDEDTGKRSLCFASGSMKLQVTKDRLAGFRQALTEAGLPRTM